MNSLLCNTGAYNEDLMELEAQRKNEEIRGRRNKRRTKETHHAGDSKEILFEEALFVFQAQDPNIDRLLCEGCSSGSEINLVLTCPL